MTEIWLKQCPICLVDLIPLKNFRFFSCGHKWCSSCLKKNKGDPLCGECRQPKGKPHRIYLDLEDLVDEQVALVADGLNAINMECSSSDVEKFNRAVRNLRQKPTTDPAISRALLEATKDLKERVAPLADRCEELEALNKVLARQLEELQSQNRISKDKQRMAKQSMQAEKEETKRLRAAVERQRIAKEGVMIEKNELQTKVEERDREIKLLNTKLRALTKKQKMKSTRSAEDPDASLQVEPSKTGLDTRHRVENRATNLKRASDVGSPRPFKKVRTCIRIPL